MTPQAQLEVNHNGAAHVPEYITLQATINRIVFHNPENGYCVISVTIKEEDRITDERLRDVITGPLELKLTGHLAAPRINDEYRFTGTWSAHPKFGRQLKFSDAELLLPVGKSGIARYISQITAGVGVAKAEKIVAALGENALDQIRENPDALNHESLNFLTDQQKSEITADLTKNSVQAELAALICGPGVGMGTVHKILNTLGAEAITLVKGNPYCLCDEVFGIGFKLADAIALKVGIPKNSPFRVDAALDYVLKEAAGEGHCYLTPLLIVEALLGTVEAERLMGCKLRGKREKKKEGIIAYSGVGIEEIKEANHRLIEQRRCVREADSVYAKSLFIAEKIVAEIINQFLNSPDREAGKTEIINAHIADIESRDSITYETLQRQAIITALQKPISIIHGGPGTGKSEITRAIVEIYGRRNPVHQIYLAAPTGKAAKRLAEATGMDASTIHRLLGYNPREGGFTYNIDEPLPGPGLILIDEFSMVDLELAADLLAATETTDPRRAHQVVIVGDPQQLPSVGPGSVLRDLIACSRIPSTQLQFNYRQAQGSVIAERANLICRGEMPPLKSAGDWEYVSVEGAAEAAETVKWLIQTYVQGEGLGLLDWLCVAPMYKGDAGITALNREIREIVNPKKPGIGNGGNDDSPELGSFRVGDKLLCTKNSYDLGCFNGDTGIVTAIEKGKLSADFGDGLEVEIPFESLENFKLGYCVSIHKAQGSQAPVLFMVLTKQNYMLLNRQILYTGITRAQKRLILVAEDLAIRMAVQNGKVENRYSRLKERISGE